MSSVYADITIFFDNVNMNINLYELRRKNYKRECDYRSYAAAKGVAIRG